MKIKKTEMDNLFLEVECHTCMTTKQEKDELIKVQNTPHMELPLLLGDVQTGVGLDLIERRFRKGA